MEEEEEVKVPKAEFSGDIHIGDVNIPCHVLDNGDRVVSTRGIMKSLGRKWRGRKYTGTQYPVFIEAKNLKPYISNDLNAVLSPIKFQIGKRKILGEGFKAEVLPMVCETYLKARDEGKLTTQQILIAQSCEILIRSFAKLGIIALIDEATGYQEIRDRFALQKILDKYLTDEWAKWTKTFPDEFYKELFRLKKQPYPPGAPGKRPGYVGHWTNDVVYSRLAPGVLKTLKSKNPRQDSGNRKRRHHQYLTKNYGHPALKEHLSNTIFLMKASANWSKFYRALQRAAPKYGDTMELPMEMKSDK